jgi:hypothetical protein
MRPPTATDRPWGATREQIERIIERRAVELAYQPLADLATLRHRRRGGLPRFRTRPHASPESWLVEAAKARLAHRSGARRPQRGVGHVGMLLRSLPRRVHLARDGPVRSLRDLIRGVDQSRIALELNEESATSSDGALDELRADGVRSPSGTPERASGAFVTS